MGIFDMLKTAGIEEGVQRFREAGNAVLLDVRTRQEYMQGHIPGSINLPLQQIEDAEDEIEKDAKLFVYCLSGGRSSQATEMLRDMGFADVCNIGGIEGYRGELER